MQSRVNIKRLKTFVFENFPQGAPVRELLLMEDDELAAADFLLKLEVWLRLLKMEPHQPQ